MFTTSLYMFFENGTARPFQLYIKPHGAI